MNETGPPGVAETHVSTLFFAGDRTYKLKKSIRTPFLDFSTPDLRRRACEREVALNRRLAPDVYLGVATVLGVDGEVCDHLVVMRRMPEERRLATLVASGGEDCLEPVAEVVAAFHRGAETGEAIAAEGTRDAVAGRWEANIAEVDALEPPAALREQIDPLNHLARDFLAGRKPLFDSRIAAGKIRDGHGDLLADDVFCLDDGPRILDCLEFDDRLRYVDVLDDACFLAMDLQRLAGRECGKRFLAAYARASGEEPPRSLAHHYCAYRAHVRAKVALIRHSQGDAAAGDLAAQLLGIALDHLRRGRVLLVLVGGLPGTGKSTLARGLAERRGWSVLRSDEVRKELAGMPPAEHAGSAYREGIYSSAMSERTYTALLERAGKHLEMGTPVVLDASWGSADLRAEAERLASRHHAKLVRLACRLPEEEAARRMEARAQAGGDPSDAGAEIARSMAADFDPWPDAIPVDTGASPDRVLAAASEEIKRLTEAP